jgi:two-component system KDP operon response regulator KdpE
MESVWGPQYAGEAHYLKVYAYRIRRKLHDEGGDFLQSDPSVGYRLVPPASGHQSLTPDKPRDQPDVNQMN